MKLKQVWLVEGRLPSEPQPVMEGEPYWEAPPIQREMFSTTKEAMECAWFFVNDGAEDVRVRLIHSAKKEEVKS